MSLVDMSVDEYLEVLKRSSLPTIITEGRDDYKVFRRMEREFSDIGVSLMPVGGKDKVIQIFNRRQEYGHIKTAYIIDRDCWVFTSVPEDYNNKLIVLTDGYSIENDMYRDGNIEDFLYDEERERYYKDLDGLVDWFSSTIQKYLNGDVVNLDIHPNRIVDEEGRIKSPFREFIDDNSVEENLRTYIKKDYKKYVRGKNLIALILRYLSHSSRESKYSRANLMEMATVKHGIHMQRFYAQISNVFR